MYSSLKYRLLQYLHIFLWYKIVTSVKYKIKQQIENYWNILVLLLFWNYNFLEAKFDFRFSKSDFIYQKISFLLTRKLVHFMFKCFQILNVNASSEFFLIKILNLKCLQKKDFKPFNKQNISIKQYFIEFLNSLVLFLLLLELTVPQTCTLFSVCVFFF